MKGKTHSTEEIIRILRQADGDGTDRITYFGPFRVRRFGLR